MATCLVTGGNGFTGRYLISLLKRQGHRVVALSSEPCDADEVYNIKLNDGAALDSLVHKVAPQHVYHLAALSFVAHQAPLDFYRVNVLGTETLLDALSRLSVPPSVLLASSANVYGANGQAIIDESVPPAPVNHYANSKLAMEYIARTYAQKLPLLIVRPFNYTGLGQAGHFLIPKMVYHFKQRTPYIELGNINVSRDFSDVRDVVAIYSKLLNKWPVNAVSGDILNVGSGQAVALETVLHKLEELSGHHLEVKVNSKLIRVNEIPTLQACTVRLNSWVSIKRRYTLDDTLMTMLEC